MDFIFAFFRINRMCLNVCDFSNMPLHTHQMAHVGLIAHFPNRIASTACWHGDTAMYTCRPAFPLFRHTPIETWRICCVPLVHLLWVVNVILGKDLGPGTGPGTCEWPYDVDVGSSESVNGKHRVAESTIWDYWSSGAGSPIKRNYPTAEPPQATSCDIKWVQKQRLLMWASSTPTVPSRRKTKTTHTTSICDLSSWWELLAKVLDAHSFWQL